MQQRAVCPRCAHQFELAERQLAREHEQLADCSPSKGCDHAAIDATPASGWAPAPVDQRNSLGAKARRGRHTWAGIVWRAVAAATLLLAGGALLLAGGRLGGWSWRGEPRAAVRPESLVIQASPSAAAISLRENLPHIEQAIVRIEADGPSDLDSLGSGFVIDSSGLVATSYHVVAEHTQARARFQDGTVFDIAGYVALAPQADLAIVQLRDVTRPLPALPLAGGEDPGRLASVVAIGHPQGINFSLFDGRVSRVLPSLELPRHSQQFLQQLMHGALDQMWIQHTARISAGNSGGPLLNERGEVLGINTWVDQQTGFGYALHVRHLHDLRERGLEQLRPLDKFARQEARVAEMLRRLTASRVEQLAGRARQMRWQPGSAEDYETLQQLAWAVTVAHLPGTLSVGEGIDNQRLSELIAAADQVVRALRQETWTEPGQFTIVNDFAARNVGRPLAGLFFFGTVERVVDGDDGARAALMRLAGTEQMLFLPLDGQLTRLVPGKSYLVLGVNYDGHVVRYGDNPLRPRTADVIASSTLLPLD